MGVREWDIGKSEGHAVMAWIRVSTSPGTKVGPRPIDGASRDRLENRYCGGKQMDAAALGVCASGIAERYVQRLQLCIAKAARDFPGNRVSVKLAFVLFELCDGKLSCTVPRGLDAGNRVWLPSSRPGSLTC